jgi:urea transport system permease protein
VAWAQTLFSEQYPSGWIYGQGLLFIVVVGFFPAGLAGLGVLLKRRRKAAAEPQAAKAPDADPDAEKVGVSS